jgi:hypothetical protein
MMMDLDQNEVDMITIHRAHLKACREEKLAKELRIKNCKDHNWEYDGHGHNYSVYKCTKCGKEEER